MLNEIWLEFCVYDFDDISHEELSAILDLEPTRIFIKGQPKRNLPNAPLWKGNCWRYKASEDVFMPFEDQMTLMLNVIEQRKEAFRTVSNRYACEFSLGLYIYTNTEESTPSVHFDQRYLQVMSGLNVEFDVDIILLEE